MENQNSAANLIVGLIIGFTAGIAIGLLYAPKPGNETRSMIKEKATVIKEKAGEAAEEIKGRVSRMTKRGENPPAESGV